MTKSSSSVYSEGLGLSIPMPEGSSPSMRSINPILGTLRNAQETRSKMSFT